MALQDAAMITFSISPRPDGKAYSLSGGNLQVLPYPLWFVDLENALAYAEECAGGREGEVTLLNECGVVMERISWKVARQHAAKFDLVSFLRSIPHGIFAFRMAASHPSGPSASAAAV
jgi:hypothetical protein